MRNYRRNPKFHSRRIAGELLLYDEKKNRVIALNETASLILNCCDGRHSKEDIVFELKKRYDVTTEMARKDVAKTLTSLKSAGAVL